MGERTVTIYALEHGGRAYVGSALDPMVRLRAHVEGAGAECTRRWIRKIEPALPEFRILGGYPESDRVPAEEAWIAEYVCRGWDMVNGTFRVWPIDSEAIRQSTRIRLANGTHPFQDPEARKKQIWVTRARNKIELTSGTHPFLDPKVRQRQRRASSLASKVRVANGTHHILDPEHQRLAGHRAAETDKADGWKNARRAFQVGRHTRWHVNRGIAKPECPLCQETSQ